MGQATLPSITVLRMLGASAKSVVFLNVETEWGELFHKRLYTLSPFHTRVSFKWILVLESLFTFAGQSVIHAGGKPVKHLKDQKI